MSKGLSSGLLLAIALAGCASSPAPDEAPRPPALSAGGDDACGASRVQGRLGHDYTEAMQQAIAQQSQAQRVRVIRPGQGYTLDYRPERLNIHLDEGERISELRCG